MKKIEKLKLNEMQDFTAIEKNESVALKGGVHAATLDAWSLFLNNSEFGHDWMYHLECPSGERFLRDGKEYWSQYRMEYFWCGSFLTGQIIFDGCGSFGGSGSWVSYTLEAPIVGSRTYGGVPKSMQNEVGWF